MSRRYTYYGSKKSREYFLDLYPSEYYYSLNRGSVHTTDVARAISGSDDHVLTPEDIEQSTLTALYSGSEEVRIERLTNQGTAGRNLTASTSGVRPYLADSARLPFIFNGMNYVDFRGAERLNTGNVTADNALLDKNCTVYLVYRSQGTAINQGVFYEQRSGSAAGPDRIGMFSDTRATDFRHTVYSPDATVTQLTYAAQQPTNTIRVVAYRKTGTTVEAFDENGLVASATNSETFSNNIFFELGRQQAGPLWFTGFVGCVIVRAQSDSNSTLNDIFDFLKTEYGI
jgi:hypothetical protein